jgi:hypothetical protein
MIKATEDLTPIFCAEIGEAFGEIGRVDGYNGRFHLLGISKEAWAAQE